MNEIEVFSHKCLGAYESFTYEMRQIAY